jgi:DNA-binding transcriptional MerR regulator
LGKERIYTVSQLGKLAGVSVRTLHYYDQVGLLKSNRRKDNGFREYNEQSIVRLQQILIYRELDFSIEKIRELLANDQYDLVKALSDQKSMLLERVEQAQVLINSIDVTMKTAKGKINRDIMFEGFPTEKVERWDNAQIKKLGEEGAKQHYHLLGGLSEEDAREYGQQSDRIYTEYAKVVGMPVDSPIVQSLIEEWYLFLNGFLYTLYEEFTGIGHTGFLHFAAQVLEDEVTTEMHEYYSPGLAEHLNRAMVYFAEHTLLTNIEVLRKQGSPKTE